MDEALITELRGLILEMLIAERVLSPDKADEMRLKLEKDFVPDGPLAALGWDSIQFPALLVRIEDHYGIDTSDLSVFEIFTVGDLVREIQARIDAKGDA